MTLIHSSENQNVNKGKCNTRIVSKAKKRRRGIAEEGEEDKKRKKIPVGHQILIPKGITFTASLRNREHEILIGRMCERRSSLTERGTCLPLFPLCRRSSDSH